EGFDVRFRCEEAAGEAIAQALGGIDPDEDPGCVKTPFHTTKTPSSHSAK
ncbi:MAG: hypothetical protein QOD29_4273, partial [Alphaproteobacteria bacterium]|nr:hypothetical protein [Alphaproteobacteria bacterium]